MGGSDDAGVWTISEDTALLLTVDFLTPIVDDPFTFGRIAASNALSDVYAMGGRPLAAMNIVCFPLGELGIDVLEEVLKGGLERMGEAGIALAGGHSVDDREIKYGLSVTGMVHPGKILRNTGSRPADRIVLTKPIGTGIVNTALKGGMASNEAVAASVASMIALNREASEAMIEAGARACTDVTGFGLLGHACEMVQDSGVGMKIDPEAVPLLPGVREFVSMGLVPAGTQRNREFREPFIENRHTIDGETMDILFDPQTSGGLLIAVPSSGLDGLMERLGKAGNTAAVIGDIVEQPEGRIVLV